MVDLSSLGILWRREDALTLVSKGVLRGFLLDGVWQSPFPGVYADGGIVLDADRWAKAAVLATVLWRPLDDVVICGRTAARVRRIPLIDDHDPATKANDQLNHDMACARHLGSVRSVPVGPEDPVHVLHRYQHAFAAGETEALRDCLITTVPRTLFDLALLITREALVCAMDHVLHEQLATREELEELAQSKRGQAGCPAFAEALALSDGRAESPAETLTRLLLLPHLPGLVPQVRVLKGSVVIARLDLADTVIKLAVESDGKRGHSGERMAAKDHDRDAGTGALGWWTERVTWYQVRRQQENTLRRVLARADTLRRPAAKRCADTPVSNAPIPG